MAANLIFNDVINCIENSQINYIIHKTPFSANISIKCSFIKKFGDCDPKDTYDEVKPSNDIKKFKDQIVKLEERLKFAEAALEDKSSIEISLEEIAEAKNKLENVHVIDKAFSVCLGPAARQHTAQFSA